MLNQLRLFLRNCYSYIICFKLKITNSNVIIGKNSRIEWNVKFKGVNPILIGNNVSIRDGAILIPDKGSISIGNNCSIGAYNILDGSGELFIGNHVRIGSHVCIYSANHIFESRTELIYKQGMDYKKVIVNDDVWIGAHVTILAGVSIGEGAVLAAGSVVTKDVLPYTIVAGVPAKPIKERVAKK